MADGFRIRQVRGEDWRRLKELRLAALADPVAPVAFSERYEVAAGRPDSFWRQRAAQGYGTEGQGGDGRRVTTFVAETTAPTPVTAPAETPSWAGMVTVLARDDTASVVGVYLRAEHRGSGIAAALFAAAERWAFARDDVVRLQLDVHERNDRARAFYTRLGFTPTGESEPHTRPPYGRCHVYALERRPATPGR
ncbi:GNAT family N-acetyltransferase [Streptomyces sp. Z26]|uniref:GNAT family N-acetyltransferase n=1 Tax=Streptomyces sp. Z26 TaxID=2500177 RepID=UPI000EF16F36|nr:GNAT family N-acetyltransferase [Streptomyces sp. Z26]RLL67564.1 GNAT family N-acetyltransferase [Streptomyces sp. Z26]